MNGVGTKAVNALSGHFKVESYRDGEMKRAVYKSGELIEDDKIVKTDEKKWNLH